MSTLLLRSFGPILSRAKVGTCSIGCGPERLAAICAIVDSVDNRLDA